MTTSVSLSASAYLNIIAHAFKFPSRPVAGLLLKHSSSSDGSSSSDMNSSRVVACDVAIPLFHSWPSLMQMELALMMTTNYAQLRDLTIVGAYYSNSSSSSVSSSSSSSSANSNSNSTSSSSSSSSSSSMDAPLLNPLLSKMLEIEPKAVVLQFDGDDLSDIVATHAQSLNNINNNNGRSSSSSSSSNDELPNALRIFESRTGGKWVTAGNAHLVTINYHTEPHAEEGHANSKSEQLPNLLSLVHRLLCVPDAENAGWFPFHYLYDFDEHLQDAAFDCFANDLLQRIAV